MKKLKKLKVVIIMMPINSNNIKITSYYGNRSYIYQGRQVNDFHRGIDLIGGSDILACEDGIVTSISNVGEQFGRACYVRLKHNNGINSLYYHLKSGSVCVSVGQHVKKGDKLGIMGATGQATGIHLHFQLDYGNSASSINPYDYLFNGVDLFKNENNLSQYSDNELADMVIQGKFGNGEQRKNALGNRYNNVQNIVNLKLNTQEKHESFDLLDAVRKTIRGDYGNGEQRKNTLGSHYNEVQNQVNLNYKNGTTNWNNIRLY